MSKNLHTTNKRVKIYQKELPSPDPDGQVEQREVMVTTVFKATKECDSKYILEMGGTRSSKSHSISQILSERFFGFSDVGRKLLVIRKTMPSLRESTMPLIYNIIQDYGLFNLVREEKQQNNLWFGRSQLHFGSLDQPSKIRSSEWNDVLMEEANEFTYADFMNIQFRMSAPDHGLRNQLFLNINPTDEYNYIKTKLVGEDREHPLMKGLKVIHSTYRDNPFLSDDYIEQLEATREQDPNYWNIFGEGNWGKLENLIYRNWEIVDSEMEGGDEIYGLDFGFNNPTAMGRLLVDGYEAYVEEKIYEERLTNSELIERMKKIIPEQRRGEVPIYADSAEPQRIEEINQAGFWCIPADKDVLDGIDFVKRFHLYIADGSENVKKEIRSYCWQKDKNEKVLDKPIKFNDHTMDLIRYGLYTHEKKRGDMRIRFL